MSSEQDAGNSVIFAKHRSQPDNESNFESSENTYQISRCNFDIFNHVKNDSSLSCGFFDSQAIKEDVCTTAVHPNDLQAVQLSDSPAAISATGLQDLRKPTEESPEAYNRSKGRSSTASFFSVHASVPPSAPRPEIILVGGGWPSRDKRVQKDHELLERQKSDFYYLSTIDLAAYKHLGHFLAEVNLGKHKASIPMPKPRGVVISDATSFSASFRELDYEVCALLAQIHALIGHASFNESELSEISLQRQSSVLITQEYPSNRVAVEAKEVRTSSEIRPTIYWFRGVLSRIQQAKNVRRVYQIPYQLASIFPAEIHAFEAFSRRNVRFLTPKNKTLAIAVYYSIGEDVIDIAAARKVLNDTYFGFQPNQSAFQLTTSGGDTFELGVDAQRATLLAVLFARFGVLY